MPAAASKRSGRNSSGLERNWRNSSASRTGRRAAQRKASRVSDQFAANLHGLRLSGSKDFKSLVDSVVFGSRNILRIGGRNSKATREEVSRQFDIARKRVQTAMDRKVISVKEGTARLHELAKKELGLYGISAGRVNVVLAKGAGGQMRPTQRGAYIGDGQVGRRQRPGAIGARRVCPEPQGGQEGRPPVT